MCMCVWGAVIVCVGGGGNNLCVCVWGGAVIVCVGGGGGAIICVYVCVAGQ